MIDLVASVDQIYRNLDGEISRHWVVDEALAKFSASVRRLQLMLSASADDQTVASALGWFRRLRYVLACTPITFAHALDHCVRPPVNLEELVRGASAAYPQASAALEETRQTVDAMRSAKADMISTVVRLASTEAPTNVAVVTRFPRYTTCAQSALWGSGTDRPTVLTASALLGLDTFDRVIICGPASWYPTSLRTAPRAPEIHIVCHAWISDSLEVKSSLIGDSATVQHLTARVRTEGNRPVMNEATIEARELEPRLDAAALVRQAHAATEDRRVELALLVVLDEQLAVFLAADESSDVLAVELASGVAEVVHVAPSRLREGTFVVLRTKGGADYVRDVADSILGYRARAARELQSDWKTRLFERMRLEGIRAVVHHLRELGVAHAAIGNVERWASDRGIALAERVDFAKLLSWLGLSERLDVTWESVQLLRATHTRAGAAIRDQLEAEIRRVEVATLQSRGRMDFTLPVAGAGVLTAFRVIRVTRGTHEIPSNQIGKPFEFAD